MKAKNCLIFGGSGQIGSFLIRKLTKNNLRATVVTRNIHQKGLKIKTQANAGYIDIVEANIFEEKKLEKLFSSADYCINLVGILYEKKRGNTFKNVHSVFPSLLAKLCKKYELEHFVHISALGVNEAIDSNYAISKLAGEKNILNNFSKSTILRPSVVFSNSDNFSTQFMTLLSRLPIFPLYYSGKTKFMPIHCSDLTDIIFHILSNGSDSQIIECIGPEILSLKDILEILLDLINKKRLLIPFPLPVAKFSAKFFQLFPKPLLTEDQLKLLKYDNIFIDCPPSLSLLTIMALVSSDELLVPLQAEFFALEGITQLIKTIDRIKVGLNPNLSVRGILLTMYDKRNRLSAQVEKDARDYFKEKVYQTVVPRNVRLSEAPSHGVPVLIYDKQCSGSKSYTKFTEEFLAQESSLVSAA